MLSEAGSQWVHRQQAAHRNSALVGLQAPSLPEAGLWWSS